MLGVATVATFGSFALYGQTQIRPSQRLVRLVSVLSADLHTLTIGADCALASPCPVSFPGYGAVMLNSPASVTGWNGTGSVIAYVTLQGQIWVSSATVTFSCSGCQVGTVGSSFPFGVIALFVLSVTKNLPDAGGFTDLKHAITGYPAFGAGSGTVVSEGPGNLVVYSVDSTMVAVFVTPPPTSTTLCSPQQFSYDVNFFYVCTAMSTWHRVAWTAGSW